MSTSSTPGPGPAALVRRPIAAFLTAALGIGWVSLGAAVALELPLEPFLLLANFGGLLGTALVITARTSGWVGVRCLLAGAVRWRVGFGWWVLALTALPTATLAIAALTGTLRPPGDGWTGMALAYLTGTVVVGALMFNVWEEVAWAGFVQARLTRRHGLLRGAALTAIPFAAIHVPLTFAGQRSRGEVAMTIAALFAIAMVFRALAGLVLAATGGSVLLVAVVHASFNASGQLGAVQGRWQGAAALVVVTTAVALMRHLTRRERRIQDEILIDAPIQDVWEVLTDFPAHAQWNPFLRFDRAGLEVGARLRVRVSPPGAKARTFTPELTAYQPPSTYEWVGRVGLPGILDARHRFRLTETTTHQTRLHQEEVFTGVLAPFFPDLLARTESGFRAMHTALKTRVESRRGSGIPVIWPG